jgi:hypothetical protein
MIIAAMVIDVSLTNSAKIGMDYHEARGKTTHQAGVIGMLVVALRAA